MRIFCLVLLLGFATSGFAREELATESRAVVHAQKLVDAGELAEARVFLATAVSHFPHSDTLLVLQGQALWESREEEAAERAFMEALRVNPLNTVAKTYIEVIRQVLDLQTSKKWHVFEEVAWDKAGDVVVLAMGFFLGMMLSGWVQKFNESRSAANNKRLFMIGQYEDFSNMLEIQLSENNLRPLRASLGFMLQHKSLEESIEILSRYVTSEDSLNTLVRMMNLSSRKGAP